MRIREKVFAVYPRREWRNTLNNEENGPNGGSRRRPNDAMRVLTKRAICVACTVRMEVRDLDRSTEDQQERKNGDKQNASERFRPPNLLAERHK